MMLAISFLVVVIANHAAALWRTEDVNKDAARSLYTLAETCKYYNCPANWPPRTADRDSCYIYISTKREWNDARKSCESMGANLVAFDTYNEIRTVREFLQSVYKLTDYPVVWTALNDREKEGRYVWEGFGGWMGKDNSLWSDNQPDNYQHWYNFWSSSDEDCVESNGYRLNDEECDDKQAYICEFHP